MYALFDDFHLLYGTNFQLDIIRAGNGLTEDTGGRYTIEQEEYDCGY